VLAVDRAGDVVLSGGADAQVACTDLAAGRAQLFQGHVGAVRAVRLLPGGDALSASVDGTVRRWRVPSGAPVWVARPPGGAPAALSVAGPRALVGGEGGLVSVLDLETGDLLGVLPGHSRRVVAVGAAHTGRLWSVAQDRTARAWHLGRAGALPPLLGHVGGVRACLLDGSGAWSGGRDGTVRRWAPDTGRETARWGLGPSAVQALARLGDGGLLVGGADGQLRCLAEDGRVRWSRAPAHEGPVTAVAVMADQTVLSGGADGVLRAWAPGDGAPLWAGAWHQDRLRCLALGADGRAATGGYDGQVLLGEPLVGGVTSLHTHSGPVVGVARCGAAVVSGGLDGALQVHHPAGHALREAAHPDGVVGVRALDPGRVASVGRDGFVRLWRAPDLAPLGALDLGVPLDGLGGGPDTLVVGDRRGGVHLVGVAP
jgi:WD40 repeat protein